jgi:hypothetical protein
MSEDDAREKYETAHNQFTDAKVQMDNLERTYNVPPNPPNPSHQQRVLTRQ